MQLINDNAKYIHINNVFYENSNAVNGVKIEKLLICYFKLFIARGQDNNHTRMTFFLMINVP